jgi:hypothetical protein
MASDVATAAIQASGAVVWSAAENVALRHVATSHHEIPRRNMLHHTTSRHEMPRRNMLHHTTPHHVTPHTPCHATADHAMSRHFASLPLPQGLHPHSVFIGSVQAVPTKGNRSHSRPLDARRVLLTVAWSGTPRPFNCGMEWRSGEWGLPSSPQQLNLDTLIFGWLV